MNKERIWNWIRERISVQLAAVFLLSIFTWDYMKNERLDARFESSIGLDTTIAKIEFVKAGWISRERWYAQYKTHEGHEIRVRFWPRFEYPRNPRHAERIKIVYLKDETEEFRWLFLDDGAAKKQRIQEF